jgi:hypothetical protein
VSPFRQLSLFTVSAALLVLLACVVWSALIPVDRACDAQGSPCSHDTPFLFGVGIELLLLLFYVVMMVGLAAKTRSERRDTRRP